MSPLFLSDYCLTKRLLQGTMKCSIENDIPAAKISTTAHRNTTSIVIRGPLTMGLIHEPFLRTNVLLSPTYEDFTKIVAFINFFLLQDFS